MSPTTRDLLKEVAISENVANALKAEWQAKTTAEKQEADDVMTKMNAEIGTKMKVLRDLVSQFL